ncbi:DUF5753 domain-containing protein [Actinocorallia longicatena]|uniref:DUF5753 domain-containing protein n=1 Tax=Actinocorallia longicatena TaxID=111803 RepID=A0ABP6QMN1_9ACTN
MASRNPPLGRNLLIGAELLKLREEQNMTINAVARKHHHSPTWLSTVENGFTTVRADDLDDLLTLYDCGDARREALLYLARSGRRRGWWNDFADEIPPVQRDHASLEADAMAIFEFHMQLVPGLLQTRDYTREIFEASRLVEPERFSALCRFREERKRLLLDGTPPHYQAIISESVLGLVVASPAVLRAQLTHLLEMTELSHVDVRIIPRSHGYHSGTDGNFAILDFKPAGLLRHVNRGALVAIPPIVSAPGTHKYGQNAAALAEFALPSTESREFLGRVISGT